MPIINRLSINANNEDEHFEALVNKQTRNEKNYDISRNYDSFSIGSTVAVVGRDVHNHSNRSYMIRFTRTS